MRSRNESCERSGSFFCGTLQSAPATVPVERNGWRVSSLGGCWRLRGCYGRQRVMIFLIWDGLHRGQIKIRRPSPHPGARRLRRFSLTRSPEINASFFDRVHPLSWHSRRIAVSYDAALVMHQHNGAPGGGPSRAVPGVMVDHPGGDIGRVADVIAAVAAPQDIDEECRVRGRKRRRIFGRV